MLGVLVDEARESRRLPEELPKLSGIQAPVAVLVEVLREPRS